MYTTEVFNFNPLYTLWVLDNDTRSAVQIGMDIEVTCTVDTVNESESVCLCVVLTLFQISLDYNLILLLVSATDHQVILRTYEPEELLKPAS